MTPNQLYIYPPENEHISYPLKINGWLFPFLEMVPFFKVDIRSFSGEQPVTS